MTQSPAHYPGASSTMTNVRPDDSRGQGWLRVNTLTETETPRVSEPGDGGFAACYLAQRADIYHYVRRLIGHDEDAEDLTVTTFEKALRAWNRRPPGDDVRPWLFRIATNTCLDELRRRRRIQWRPWETIVGLFHPSQIAPDNPEREALRNENIALIRAALAKLPPRDRAALLLREEQGLSTEQVGDALGISRAAAKVALFRARERLRTIYLEIGGEAPAGWKQPVVVGALPAEQGRPETSDVITEREQRD